MILKRFRRRLREYGYRRLLTSSDFTLAIETTFYLIIVHLASCFIREIPTIQIVNFDFISGLTPILASLTSFVITGLAVLVSVTDERFLSELSELDIYPNILFMFEFNILLLGWTSILSVVVTTYNSPDMVFYIFIFFFLYSLFSLAELMQLIVNTGINKARYEGNREDDEQS